MSLFTVVALAISQLIILSQTAIVVIVMVAFPALRMVLSKTFDVQHKFLNILIEESDFY
jgi:hypothetical protein